MSMNPVVLISCPNLPYFLGTFDTTRFRNWWRSAPFPEAVQYIKKGMHIYGRSHLAIAQRTDGLWAVYRSKNYGIDWERVWLAASGEVIYDILLITYGRAIMNTSTGFYETVTAGTSWTKVASLPAAPNAPVFYNIGGGDVLVCTDGRYIWRSTDIARHWTQVCDQRSILRHDGAYLTYTGLTAPCIAGANGIVLCGFGPFVSVSGDGALTWEGHKSWDEFVFVLQNEVPISPPRSIVYDRQPYQASMCLQPAYIIKQILISSVDGPQPGDVTFLLKYDDLQAMSGESNLFSRVFTTTPPILRPGWGYAIQGWRYQFQQYLSPAEGQQLSAYDLPVTGAAHNDKLAFSAQTRTDPETGEPIPSLKYSPDGGSTWLDIDVNNIQIGNPDGSPFAGGMTLDDNFARITWVHGRCDNTGSWNYAELYRRQCINHEVDTFLERKAPPSYDIDLISSKDTPIEQRLDAICEKETPVTQHIDGLLQGPGSKAYRIDRTLEGIATKEESIVPIVSIDHAADMQVDTHFWARPKAKYRLETMLHQRRSGIGYYDVILVRNRLNQRLTDMVRKLPQFPDLDVPDVPYGPYNASEETV